MKKILRILRNLLIFFCWSYLFISVTEILFVNIWNFDFLSGSSWAAISEYWNNGGVIKSPLDVLLFISFLLLPLAWLFGLQWALEINYMQILLFPVTLFYRLFNDKEYTPERVVIRNIKSSGQRAEEIKDELNSLKPAKAQSSQNIRSEITEKRTNNE